MVAIEAQLLPREIFCLLVVRSLVILCMSAPLGKYQSCGRPKVTNLSMLKAIINVAIEM
jgi:hypothetical protein